jgi:hypothetical protein
MALQKREKTMLMVLGGVLVAAILFQVLSGGGAKKKKAAKGVGQAAAKVAEKVGLADAKASKRGAKLQAFDAWAERDPFSKPEFDSRVMPPTPFASPIRLQGMVWMNGIPYVLVNDVILTQGEEKKGIRVENIEGRKVRCRKGGKVFTLEWSGS